MLFTSSRVGCFDPDLAPCKQTVALLVAILNSMFLLSSDSLRWWKKKQHVLAAACALTLPEGRQTNMEEAGEGARRQRASSGTFGNSLFMGLSGLSVYQDLEILKQGQRHARHYKNTNTPVSSVRDDHFACTSR